MRSIKRVGGPVAGIAAVGLGLFWACVSTAASAPAAGEAARAGAAPQGAAASRSAPADPSSFCPAGASQAPLQLSGVRLTRHEDIPLAYQGHNILEGPVWHAGALYYSNLGSRPADGRKPERTSLGTLWRWQPGQVPQVWLDDNAAGTNGLALDPRGNLVAARQLDGSIASIDWRTKAVTPLAGSYEDKRFNSPNDLAVGRDGSIYFSDPNWNIPSGVDLSRVQGGGAPGSTEPGQRVYRVAPGGAVTPLAVTELVPELRDKPNGILLSLDEQRLYVGGLRGLWVFDLAHGQVSQPRKLLDSSIDGMTKDCAGHIYLTTSRQVPVVVVLDSQHREVGQLEVPEVQAVTNVAFGGDEGNVLFVTTLTFPVGANGKPRLCGEQPCLPASIYSARLPVRGFPY